MCVDLLDFLSLVLFIIFGGIAGFITNKIAISHLFKNIYFFGRKFKPFKSVIARTRDELAENISGLVEEKIITPEKMLDAGERNKILLDEEINKILLKAGNSEGSGKSVADFDTDGNFEKALEKTTGKIISDNLTCLVEDVLSVISFDELIDEETVCNVLGQLIPIFISDDNFNKCLLEFFETNQQLDFKTLLGEEIYFGVKESFKDITKDALDNTISNDMPQIIRIIENIIYEGGFEKDIKELLYQISERKVNSLSGSTSNVDFNNSILNLIKDFIVSDGFKNLVKDENPSRVLYEGLAGIDLKMEDILPDGFWESINTVLPGKIDEIVPVIRDFINENEIIILDAIDSSLEKAIEKETSGRWLANKTRKLAKNIIIKQIWDKTGSEYKIIKKINDTIKEKSDTEIKKSVVDFINSKFRCMTVAELVNNLTGNGESSGKYIKFIYKIVRRNINKTSDNKILASIFDKMGNISLSVFLSEKNINNLYNTGKNKVLQLAGNKIMEKETSSHISNKVTGLFDKYCGKSVYSFTSENNFHVNIEDKSICEKLTGFIINNLYRKPVKDILGKQAVAKLAGNFANKTSGFAKKLYHGKIRNILLWFFEKKEFRSFLSRGIIKFLPVKKMVNNGVREMDTDDLCNKMNDFFGRELKPLERMGIVMGAVFGIAVWAIQHYCFKSEVKNAGMLLLDFNGILPFILSILIFALIGIITNFFAVYFLFQPYEKKFGMEWFQGYICREKNKKRCADGIAVFIDDNFLGKELDLKNMLQNKVKYYSSNNFAMARNQTENNKQKITDWICKKLNCNTESIADMAAGKVYGYARENTLNEVIRKNTGGILNFSAGLLEGHTDYFAGLIAGKLPNIKLGSLIDAGKIADKSSEEIIQYIEENIFNEEYVKDIFKKMDGSFNSLKSRKITDLFNENDLRSLINGLVFSTKAKLLVEKFLNNIFETGFNKTETLGTVFGGVFKKLVNDNIDFIFDIIISEIKERINIDELSHDIVEDMKEKQKLLEKIGGYFIDLDNLIKETLILFFENDFDRLLKENEIKIKNLFRDNVFEKIFNTRIPDIINDSNKIKLDSLVNKFFEKIPEHKDTIEGMVEKAASLLFNTASRRNIRAGDLLGLLKINNSMDIYNRFATEINGVIYNAKKHLHSGNIILKDEISALLGKIITNNYLDLEISDFTRNTDREEISKQVSGIFQMALKDGTVNHYLSSCIEDMPVIYISSLINEDETSRGVNNLIKYIMENEVLEQNFENTVNGIIDILCNDGYGIFESKAAAEVFKNSLGGIAENIDKEDLRSIMDCFEFKKIICTSIENLDGSEIHNLFKSFAGKYLDNLVLMGWMGAFFGTFNIVNIMVFIYYLAWLGKELDKEGE